jgi:hypothetical protein
MVPQYLPVRNALAVLIDCNFMTMDLPLAMSAVICTKILMLFQTIT